MFFDNLLYLFMANGIIGVMITVLDFRFSIRVYVTPWVRTYSVQGTQQSTPAFLHQSLPRQCMPSPSLNRPLHLDRDFGKGFCNRTAFIALGCRQSADFHPFIGMIGTSGFTQCSQRWAAVNVCPSIPCQCSSEQGPSSRGRPQPLRVVVSCDLAVPNLQSTSTHGSTASPRRPAKPGRMVTCCHIFFFFIIIIGQWDMGLGGVGVWSRTTPSGVVSFWSYRFSTERQRNRRDNKK